MQPSAIQSPTKPRRGCLMQIVIVILVIVALSVVLTAIFSPWGFFMGGHFHPYPRWQGWGRLHSSTAGDFVLFVRIVPGGTARSSGPRVTGNGILCTPRGEKYNLGIGGEFEKHFGIDFQGRKVDLTMRSSDFVKRNTGGDLRPKLHLYGRWENPNLVMDDHGTLSHAFEPDGSLYTGNFKNRPDTRETVAVTLNEGSKADFEAACAAATTGKAR